MSKLVRHGVSLASVVVMAVLLVALPRCVSDAQDGSVIQLDGGGGEATTLYGVAGTVSGLPQGRVVTLTLNGANALMAGNGAFSFPASLREGQSYTVAVSAAPAGVTCNVSNGSGVIAAGGATADAAGALVTCASSDASLVALSLSAGTLAPAFTPATRAYTAGPLRASVVFPPATTMTVTATATDPGAAIAVDGAPAKSGAPSAPVALKQGSNAIDVAVTATDGVTTEHYAIAVSTFVNDYLKASNTRADSQFGDAVAISADGSTLAIGADGESSGIVGGQSDTSALGAGAVYVFTRAGGVWSQQAYLKAQSPRTMSYFGSSVALSDDGNTLAIGAFRESSGATGVGGNQTDTSASGAGAAYVFSRAGTTWSEQAYIKASNTRTNAFFGFALALAADGNTLAVGSPDESSNATGIGGNQADTSATNAGAVYVFTRAGTAWSEQAYVKASNSKANWYFGSSVALAGDGNTLAVGATGDSSAATGVGGNQADTSAGGAGAAFVFVRAGTTWTQNAYVKASNTIMGESFGSSVALSSDGATLAVGATEDASHATGIDGNGADTSADAAGAVWVFAHANGAWSEQAYVKASNTAANASFGNAVALSADGNELAVGSRGESSAAKGVGGDQTSMTASDSGAVYAFTRAGGKWSQTAYVKASNTRPAAQLGASVALSRNGATLAAGALREQSDATGVNGNQADSSEDYAGAVYIY